MRDEILDFIEDHRVLVWCFIIVIVLGVVVATLAGIKSSKEKARERQAAVEAERLAAELEAEAKEREAKREEAIREYEESKNVVAGGGVLSGKVEAGKRNESRLDPTTEYYREPERYVEEDRAKEEYHKLRKGRVFGYQEVPRYMVNGEDLGSYYKGVCGLELKKKRSYKRVKESSKKVLYIGVYEEGGDKGHTLESVGWMMDNIGVYNGGVHVEFTNLHIVGEIREGLWLCCYDWYSAYGLEDVLVVLELESEWVSGLKGKAGKMVSVVTSVENIKVEQLLGKRVLWVSV